MANIKCVEVKEKNDIETVVLLAQTIWREHYSNILTEKQIEYMLDKFQSYQAIKKSIDGGEKYFIIDYDGIPVGYFAFKKEGGKIYLDKIYIVKEKRGEKIGGFAMDYLKKYAVSQNSKIIYLTVNKRNTDSIKAYRSYGFVVESAINTDIGEGFVMDDYQMYYYF